MSSVYSNSTLNFAATPATDGRASLFFERKDKDLISIQTCKVELPSHQSGSYILCDPNLWGDKVEGSPLAQRGWVVQERFLAPRTLHFTSQQFFWQCADLKACESFTYWRYFWTLTHDVLPHLITAVGISSSTVRHRRSGRASSRITPAQNWLRRKINSSLFLGSLCAIMCTRRFNISLVYGEEILNDNFSGPPAVRASAALISIEHSHGLRHQWKAL